MNDTSATYCNANSESINVGMTYRQHCRVDGKLKAKFPAHHAGHLVTVLAACGLSGQHRKPTAGRTKPASAFTPEAKSSSRATHYYNVQMAPRPGQQLFASSVPFLCIRFWHALAGGSRGCRRERSPEGLQSALNEPC